MTGRRGFLGALFGAASAAVLDPEKLLWVPGAKTISIPAPAIACNSFLFFKWFEEEALKILETQLQVSRMNQEHFYKAWKIGDTVRVRRPARFVA